MNKFYLLPGPFNHEVTLYPNPPDGCVHFHVSREELRDFLRKRFWPFSIQEYRVCSWGERLSWQVYGIETYDVATDQWSDVPYLGWDTTTCGWKMTGKT
jgi:hypothetical protein